MGQMWTSSNKSPLTSLLNKKNKDVAFVAKNEMTTLSDKCYAWMKDGRIIGLKLKERVRSLCLKLLGLA